MSPYFESIRLQHQQIQLLSYHNQRLHRTRKQIFNASNFIDLRDHISLPKYLDDSIWKCRVTYGQKIEDVKFERYEGRQINSFKLVEIAKDFDYSHKGDRTGLLAYYDIRADCDDIIMIQNGYVTDSYWSNLIFFRAGRWYTPNTPLLEGTMRAFLLKNGVIAERTIRSTDLPDYEYVMPINALNPFDLSNAISTHHIKK